MNRAKSWCWFLWFLCFLGSISSFLISESLAQSDDDPYWGEDGDLPDWVEDGELPDWAEDGDLPDFGELMPADVGQGLTFRMIARDSAPRSSLDSPASGDFSIRIMPSDTGELEPIKCQSWFGIEYKASDTCWVVSPDQAGFVRVPCAADAPPFYECWESGEKVQMMDVACPSRGVFGSDDHCLIPKPEDDQPLDDAEGDDEDLVEDTGGLTATTCDWLGLGEPGDICWYARPEDAGLVEIPCSPNSNSERCYKRAEDAEIIEVACPGKPVFGPNSRCLVSVEPEAPDTGGPKDNKWETRPTNEMLITRPPATLLGHELSVSTGAGYIPRRGKSEHAASGMTYSWASLVNWSELISWTGTMDNEKVSYPNPPLGVNKELSLARQSSIGPAEALAELKVIIRPSKYDFRANGSVSLLSVNNGAPDRFAEAEADLAILVSALEPVRVSVTNCDLFDPDSFYSQSVRDFSYLGGDCSFRFGQSIESTQSDEIPDSEVIECTVAFQGESMNMLANGVLEELQDIPGLTFPWQTDRADELISAEIALCDNPYFDPASCREIADGAAEKIANPVDADVNLVSGGSFQAEGVMSVTVVSRDGRKEVFEYDWDEEESSFDGAVAVSRDIADAVIEFLLDGCEP